MDTISNCLDVFFSSSRQKVSVAKTLILSYEIKLHIRFLSYKRSWQISWRSYDTWKEDKGVKKTQHHLSRFTKVVVVALLTYTMQIVLLPKQFCDKLESMNGESQNCRRCHIISWNNFFLSKDVEGMDFRDFHLFNHALIMKLGWGLITNPNALWVHEEGGLLVMGGMLGFGGVASYFQGLLLWMLLGKIYLVMKSNSMDNEILEDFNILFSVGSFQKLWESFLLMMFYKALKLDGNFSTKQLIGDDSVRAHEIWKKIWDKDIHPRDSYFFYGKQSCGLCDNALCIVYHMKDETIIHVLRDCVNAKLVWQNISPNLPVYFFLVVYNGGNLLLLLLIFYGELEIKSCLQGRISIAKTYADLFGREHDKMFNLL
ncbi:hypothetical protein CR513_31013, partial [Mucuna pruriens]